MGKKQRKHTEARKSRAWHALVFAAFLATGIVTGIYREYWPYLAGGGALLAVGFALLRARRSNLAATMAAIDEMSGPEFERFLNKLFRTLGFKTKHVGAQGSDFGADLIIEMDGVKTAVQAKNYDTSRVGNDAVQQVIAGASFYDCAQALVVTNSSFTKAAEEQAAGSNMKVILWDRQALEKLLSTRRV